MGHADILILIRALQNNAGKPVRDEVSRGFRTAGYVCIWQIVLKI
jgi:hypothetical protein